MFICACLTGMDAHPAYVPITLAIGFAEKLLPLASKHVSVMPVAIFCGGLGAVFPIITVTYGFAIVVLVPLLALWRAIVLSGAALGKRMQQENA